MEGETKEQPTLTKPVEEQTVCATQETKVAKEIQRRWFRLTYFPHE